MFLQSLLMVFLNLLKNKCGDKCSSDSYRPIMVSSSISKLMEMILLPIIYNCMRLNIRQFGFRNNTFTSMPVSMLKEIVKWL